MVVYSSLFLQVSTTRECLFLLERTSFQDSLLLREKSMVQDFYEMPTFILRPKRDSLTEEDEKVMFRNFTKFRIVDDLLIKVTHRDDDGKQ